MIVYLLEILCRYIYTSKSAWPGVFVLYITKSSRTSSKGSPILCFYRQAIKYYFILTAVNFFLSFFYSVSICLPLYASNSLDIYFCLQYILGNALPFSLQKIQGYNKIQIYQCCQCTMCIYCSSYTNSDIYCSI